MKLIDDLRNRLTPKTPADRERVKKIAVYTVLCLSCLVCIWLIFAQAEMMKRWQAKPTPNYPMEQPTVCRTVRLPPMSRMRRIRRRKIGRLSSKAYRRHLIQLPLSQRPICRTLSNHRLTHTSRLRLHCRISISLSRQARHSR